MNLRELTDEQNAILSQVEDGDFSLDDVSDHLNMLKSERDDKIHNYLHVINSLENDLAPLVIEIERLTKIKKVKYKALENIREWLCMSMRDGETHEFDLFSVKRVKGREVVNVTDFNQIPSKFINVVSSSSADKSWMLRELKDDVEIPGAEIKIGNPSLRIK